MKHTLNFWPALTDLFSGLAAVTFGALLLYLPYTHKLERDSEQATRLQQRSTLLRTRIAAEFGKLPHIRQPRPCGEDLCLDADIQFERDRDEVPQQYQQNLRIVARNVRSALGELPADERSAVELTIEGHSDHSLPRFAASPRDAFLYNWRLSSFRAASVLYLFHEEGVTPPKFRILSLGYADSEPVCVAPDALCEARNRRTTFRIRVNSARLQEGGSGPASLAGTP